MSIFIGTLVLCLLACALYVFLQERGPARRNAIIEVFRITFAVALLVSLLGAGSQMSGCGITTTGPGVGVHVR